MGKVDYHNQTTNVSKRKCPGRKITTSMTDSIRTGLLTRAYIWISTPRWNNSREMTERTEKHKEKSGLEKHMPNIRRSRSHAWKPIMGRNSLQVQKFCLSFTCNRSSEIIPPTQSTHGVMKVYHRCISHPTRKHLKRLETKHLIDSKFLDVLRTQEIGLSNPLMYKTKKRQCAVERIWRTG